MNKVRALLGALALAAGLMVAAAAPAQAVGWSGQRCDTLSGDGWKMCVQYHTVSVSGGVWVDTVQACFTSTNTHVRGSFQNGWGSSQGDWGSLPNTGKNQCVYDYPTKAGGTMTGGACMTAKGRVDRSAYPDVAWQVKGNVLGGAC